MKVGRCLATVEKFAIQSEESDSRYGVFVASVEIDHTNKLISVYTAGHSWGWTFPATSNTEACTMKDLLTALCENPKDAIEKVRKYHGNHGEYPQTVELALRAIKEFVLPNMKGEITVVQKKSDSRV